MSTTCGIFIFDKTGNILICRPRGIKGKSDWSIPKGKREKDETPINAAIRECFEETGLDLKNFKKNMIEIGTMQYKSKKKRLIAFVVILNIMINPNDLFCKIKDDEKHPEITGYEMTNPKEAMDRIHYTQASLLEKYLKDKK